MERLSPLDGPASGMTVSALPQGTQEIPDGRAGPFPEACKAQEVRPELASLSADPDTLPTGSGIKGISPPWKLNQTTWRGKESAVEGGRTLGWSTLVAWPSAQSCHH